MMLDVFTEPDTVTCILCRATVSIRKGDKARFFNHISHDHEVHYDMDLFFVVSFLSEAQKGTVIDIISKKFDKKEKSIKPNDLGENNMQYDDSTNQNTETEIHVLVKEVSIPKTENNESLDEVSTLKTKTEIQVPVEKSSIPKREISESLNEVSTLQTEKDPLDVEADLSDDLETCSTCEMILPRKLMQSHINIEHTLGLYEKIKCKICTKKVTKQIYKMHMKRVHKIPYSQLQDQAEMGDSQVDDATANRNVEDTESVSLYTKCKLCFKTVKNSGYKRHLKSVHSGNLFHCPLCYLGFKEERCKNQHLVKVHKDEEYLMNLNREPNFSEADCTVNCPNCDKRFISEISMKWHCRILHGSGNFQCERCLKKISKRRVYDLHILRCLRAPSLMP